MTTFHVSPEEGSFFSPEAVKIIQAVLDDFVAYDCRLADHPRAYASVGARLGDGSSTEFIVAETKSISELSSTRGASPYKKLLPPEQSGGREIWQVGWGYACELLITLDSKPVGTLELSSLDESGLERKQLRLLELLAALVNYVLFYAHARRRSSSWISQALGHALAEVRCENRLTQQQLAETLSQSRVTISRWEAGSQPPSLGVLLKWCRSLGVLSAKRNAIVAVADVLPQLLKLLKQDPTRISQISPEQFEWLVADRLDRMGFDVQLTGATRRKDGGIDLIAVPKVRTAASFLLAAQVKHHLGRQKTGREAVDRILAWKDSDFRLALLVTNTEFTEDAKWVAALSGNRAFLRLRDFEDLRRWLEDNFTYEGDWREIPQYITLAPGITVEIPKPRLVLPR